MSVIGRTAEIDSIHRLFDRIRDGPAALVLEGEAGIGKTTVWEAAIAEAAAQDIRVLSTRAGEADAQLALGGLIDLFTDVPRSALQSLPRAQQVALRAALFDGDARADPLVLGMGVRNLLRRFAAVDRVLVAIDDVQWLDPASARALEFAARRLERDEVGLVETCRAGVDYEFDPAAGVAHGRLERVELDALHEDDLAELVRARLGLDLPRERRRVLATASGGNPYFALELGRSVRAGDSELEPGAPTALAPSLRDLLAARLDRAPPRVLDALLTISALNNPSPADVAPAILDACEDADFVVVDGAEIRFTHPLLRSAVYERASAAKRRARHRELAGRVDDAAERAFHLALGTVSRDEAIASELAATGERTARRGAPEAGATLLQHAARLSLDPAKRQHRLLRAVEHLIAADDATRANALLGDVEAKAGPGPIRAHALYLRCRWGDSGPRPEELARAYDEAAGDELLQLRILSFRAGALRSTSFDESRKEAHRALRMARRLRNSDLLVTAAAEAFFSDMGAGQPVDRAAIERLLPLEDDMYARGEDPVFPLSSAYAHILTYAGELDRARALLERQIARGRELGLVSPDHFLLALVEARAGRLDAAVEHSELFARDVSPAFADAGSANFIRGFVQARLGDVDAALGAGSAALRHATEVGNRLHVVACRDLAGFVALSTERWDDAVREYQGAIEVMRELQWRETGVLPTYQGCAEALVNLGRMPEADAVLDELERLARPVGRVVALAGALRGRGMLAAAKGDFDSAVAFSTASLELQSTFPEPFELARTELVLGGFLRRAGRKTEARTVLERAVAGFEEIGARLWVERARVELRRIGGRSTERTKLTATEQRIADLVASGKSNHEVATAMFISPKTVEWNLSKVYRKLSVRSRGELSAKLATRRQPDSNSRVS